MKVIVRIENVYGCQTVYPICDKAIIFAKLAGTKTLTAKSIKAIQDLGYQVVVQQAEIKL